MRRESPTPLLFDEISHYWAEIADANATEKQVEFVRSQVKKEGLALDLSCGNGRHTVALCEAGFEMVGLDISRNLLWLAKEKAEKARVKLAFIRADMQHLPFRSKVFSAVVSLDSSFGYFPLETSDLHAFVEVASALQEKGVFLIDVFNRERVLQHYGKGEVTSQREYPSFWLTQKRIANAETGLMRDLWIFQDKNTCKINRARHVVRLYSSSGLQALLEKSGFADFRIFGGYEEQEYTEHSAKLIILSHKH